jgi:translocation and assembly module TamB
MKTVRRLCASLAAITLLLALAAGLAWWSIHTAWFANLVRSRIVSALQKSTGGRVELGAFRFNPDSLHAKVSRLVIHGTEHPGSPALLSVESIDVGLKILSVWHQDVNVQSVTINQPQFHLTVKEDGSTNFPTPPKPASENPVQQLLALKAGRLEVNQAVVEINNKKVPFSVRAENTSLHLDYQFARPSYGVSIDSGIVTSSLLKISLRPIRIRARARLYRDRADVESLQLTSGQESSTIQLAGNIEHFAHASAHADVQASLSVDELAQFAGINQLLQSGRIGVKGFADFNASTNQFTFNGNANAQGVAFVSPAFTMRNMNASAAVLANNDGMLLRKGHASARGATFAGEGTIKNYQFLQVEGAVSHVALKEVGTYLTNQPFPWSASAHGRAHASAKLGDSQPDFIIGAKVDLDAGSEGIPTSGAVDVTYYNRTGKVEFGASTLVLPHTKADFQGTLDGALLLKTDSADLIDLQPLIPILGLRVQPSDLPQFAPGGSGHFNGTLQDIVHHPLIQGNIAADQFKFRNLGYDALTGQFALSAGQLSVSKLQVREAGANLEGSGSLQLTNWNASDDSPFQFSAHFAHLDLVKTLSLLTSAPLPSIKGVASGALNLHGSLKSPGGNASFNLSNLNAFGQQINQVQAEAALDGNRLQLSKGRILSGQAQLGFSGVYLHTPADWSTGNVELKADTNGFPLSSLATIEKYLPALNGRAELHIDTVGTLRSTSFEPLKMNGTAEIQHISVNGRDVGNIAMAVATQGKAIDFKYSGDLRDTKFHGAAQAQLATGTPIRGDVQIDRISLATAKSLAFNAKLALPVDGFLDGSIAFDGLLEEPAHIHAQASIEDLELRSLPRPASLTESAVPEIVLRNNQPILLDVSDGVFNITNFQIEGRDTSVKITGRAPFRGDQPVDIKAVGNADLALFMLFDPNVRSAGKTELEANIGGSISAPTVIGTLQIRNGSFFFADIPNGLSDVEGTVVFNRSRATIQKMTAHSGGGDIAVEGSLNFGEGSPLVYHLEAVAHNVRVRYANSISVTANSDLRFSGTSASSLLSGTLTVTRVVFTPNADAGNLLAAASSPAAVSSDPDDFLSGLHLDVGIESAPSLQVSTNLSRDVEAEIQLRLRGTPNHPIVLGNITANQGDIKIFGTRFSLNRGEVSFVNTVRLEPVLDLDLETQARGVTVDITVSGTPSKLNFNYRSDPPLQPRDIIALLTVGRAPDVGSTSNAQGASDVSALTSGVNSVLGQAISPVSNRLSKLFGVTNIRIDPFVQGITNTPQARLSVEQQISRDVTVTYITNLSQTSEQIFRFEWALSRQFAIVALRDDNGEFGIDFQYKKRFK